MAPPAGQLRVRNYFLSLLAVLAVLYSIVFFTGDSTTPKLGLDLKGGAQVVYLARTIDGEPPSREAMQRAREIMTQRVDAVGVAQSEVVIEGRDRLVISVPGATRAEDLVGLGRAANMSLRPLIAPPVPPAPQPTGSTSPPPSGSATSPSPSPSPSPSTSPSPQARVVPQAAATTTTPVPSPSPTASATPAPSATGTAPATGAPIAPLDNLGFPAPKNEEEYAKLTPEQKAKIAQVLQTFDCDSVQRDDPAKPFIACDKRKNPSAVYLLGSVIVPGTEIKTAQAMSPNAQAGTFQWTVSLEFKSTGERAWADYTKKYHFESGGSPPDPSSCGPTGRPCAEWVAFTLDGEAVSVPHNEAHINGTATQISGSFTQSSANLLADQLRFGALPVSFGEPLTSGTVSPTLGTAQLKAALIAGGIGLVLVVIYSLAYYRALGLVTIASLGVSALLTYALLVILGREIGFTLTLAGVAGFLVAVGITADSFVVFFERIKDEVHSGRSMRGAVPRAWVRARRTILSANTVSFLAAAVLYYFAAGEVRGFAFTLGMSTILDVIVVFVFTHPMVSLLSRSSAFGSARFTGLNAARATGTVAAAPAKKAKEQKAAKEAKTATEPAADTEKASSRVAVLEKEDPVDAAEPEEVAESEPAPPKTPAAPLEGTAAERAAARRARMRAEKEGK